jgi:hypothetical protein
MGSSSKPQTIGYRYFMGIHMGLCRGPIDELREIQVGDRVAWSGSATGQARWLISASALFGGDEGEGGIYGTIDMMLGTETQPANPRLRSMLGSNALVPAFRGVTTLFYDGLVCSMSAYPKSWKFRLRRVTSGWDSDSAWYPEKAVIWQGSGAIKSMNPAHIIYEAITNRDWGRGRSIAHINDESFRAAADKLYSEGMGLCLKWSRQDSISEMIKSVMDHISGVLLDDLDTGKISLKLIRDDYVVDDLPFFDENSGLLAIEEDDAADGSQATNEVVVKFRNMLNGGAEDVMRVQNNAAIQSLGSVLSETVEYLHVPTSGLAARLAQRDLRAKSAAIRRFKVQLDRRAASIVPGSVFRIRSLKRGYGQLVLRAGRCEYGTPTAGAVTITALIDTYGLPATSYVAAQTSTTKPPTTDPLPATICCFFEISYRDLMQYIDASNQGLLSDTSCGVAMIARRPTTTTLSYALLTRVGIADFALADTGDWCPTAQIVTALDLLTTSTRITHATDSSTIQAGSAALIGDEIVKVVSIDLATGDLVLARGCADTVPHRHAAGDRIWFYSAAWAADPTDYAPGVTVEAKIQTRTSTGILSPDLAPVSRCTTAGRQNLPYPPGQFKVNGEDYPSSISGDIVLTWAHRDRLTQADQLIDTSMGDIGPEAGTTYSARLLQADGTLLAGQSGIKGTTATFTTDYKGSISLELWSVRSALDSAQRHQHSCQLD